MLKHEERRKREMILFQQGDVLLRTRKIPEAAKELATMNLKESQVTGHAHRVHGAARLFESDGKTYLRAVEPFELRHEEHKTLTIPEGEYLVDDVLEFDHLAEEARAVAD
jgi:hypothetical protein